MKKENVFFGIDDYMAMYSPYIKRAKARELAQCYVVGLMMDGDRKSVEPMSEKAHASERGMQKLLTAARWDRDGAFGEYRRRRRMLHGKIANAPFVPRSAGGTGKERCNKNPLCTMSGIKSLCT